MSEKESDALTTDEDQRWEWLSTGVAAFTAVSLPILVGLGALSYPLIDLGSVSMKWYVLYATGYAAAIKFSLGRGEFAAIRKNIFG